jgi:hypothetical protein
MQQPPWYEDTAQGSTGPHWTALDRTGAHREDLTPGQGRLLEVSVINLLPLIVWAVTNSPACWTLEQCHERGFHPAHHICPDHATFDIWLETPGTGWYDLMVECGQADGTNPAWAIELQDAWLSWDDSSDSLAARLTHED